MMKKNSRQLNGALKVAAMIIAAIVIFTTTYSLILPAITMDQETAGGLAGIDLPGDEVSLTGDSSGNIISDYELTEKVLSSENVNSDNTVSQKTFENSGDTDIKHAEEDFENTAETNSAEVLTGAESEEIIASADEPMLSDTDDPQEVSKTPAAGAIPDADKIPDADAIPAESEMPSAEAIPVEAEKPTEAVLPAPGGFTALAAPHVSNAGVTYSVSADDTSAVCGTSIPVTITASVDPRTSVLPGGRRYAYVLLDSNQSRCEELAGIAAGGAVTVRTSDGKPVVLHKENDGFWIALDAWDGEDVSFTLNFNTVKSGDEEPDEAAMGIYMGGGLSVYGFGTYLSAQGDALRNRNLASRGYAEEGTYTRLSWKAEEVDPEPVMSDEFTVSADPIYGYFHTELQAEFHAQAGRGSGNNVFYVRQSADRSLAAILKDASPGDIIPAVDPDGNPITDRYGTQLLFHVTDDGFWFELDNSKHNNYADFNLTYKAAEDANQQSSNAAKMRLYLAQSQDEESAMAAAAAKFSPDLSLTWSDSGDKLHYKINLIWDTSIEEDKYDQNVVITSMATLEPKYILDLMTSSVNYEAGQFEMRLPYALWAYRGSTNGRNCAVPTDLSIPKEGDPLNGSLFQYRIEYDPAYPNDLTKAQLVITNGEYLPAGTNARISVKYSVDPWQSVDLSTSAITALATAQATNQSSPEYGESNTITYRLDTGFNASTLRKESTWSSSEALAVYQKPAFVSAGDWDPDNYNMVRYHISYGTSGNYNQPLTHEFLATLPEGAELVAVAAMSASRGLTIDKETGTWSTSTTSKTTSSSNGEYWFYVRYPRTDETEVTYTARLDMETTASDPDSHTPPEDYNDKDHKYLEYEFKWKDYVYDPGTIESSAKMGWGSGYVEAIPDGNIRFSWRTSHTFNAYDLKAGETHYMRMTDDAQFWKYVPKSYGTNSWRSVYDMNWLEEGVDYELDCVHYITIVYTGVNLRDGSTTYPDFAGGDLTIEAYNSSTKEWETVKTITLPEATDRTSQYIRVPYEGDALYTFAKGSGYSRLRVTSPEFAAGKLNVEVNFYTRMKQSDMVMKWIDECRDDQQVYIRNYAAFQHYSRKYDEEGVLRDYTWDNRSSAANRYAARDGIDYTLADRDVSLRQYDNTTDDGEYLIRAYAGAQLTHFGYVARMDKTTQETINDTTNQRAVVPYMVYEFEGTNIPLDEQYNEAFKAFSQNSGVFYELLPPGYKYLEGTLDAQSIKGQSADITDIEVIDNYKDSGRQMLIVHVKTGTDEPENYSYTTDPNIGAKSNTSTSGWFFGKTSDTRVASNFIDSYKRFTGFLITFQTYIPWKVLVDHASEVNLVSFARSDDQPIRRGDSNAGYPDVSNSNNLNSSQTLKEFQKVKDADGNYIFHDFNGEGEDKNRSALYACSTANPQVVDGVQTGIYKRVLGDEGKAEIAEGGDGWRQLDRTKLSGSYSYKITTYASMGVMRGLIVYDTLEDAKNKEGAENEKTWQGTFDSVDVSEAIALGFAPVIYYSTAKGLDYNTITGNEEYIWINDSSIWTTELPEDKSKVTAIAVDLRKMKDGSDAILRSKSGEDDKEPDQVSFLINMTAPKDFPTDPDMIYAINRPAYSCYQKGFFSAEGVHKNDIGLRVKIRLIDEYGGPSLDLNILKVEAGSGAELKSLSGAQFVLNQLDPEGSGTYLQSDDAEGGKEVVRDVESDVTGADGMASFTDLLPGYYEVKESKVPDGHILTGNGRFYVKLEDDGSILLLKTMDGVSVKNWPSMTETDDGLISIASSGHSVVVGNRSGAALPSTGGTGSGIFIILGSILTMGAMVMIARRIQSVI